MAEKPHNNQKLMVGAVKAREIIMIKTSGTTKCSTPLFFFIDVNPTQIKARTWHFNVVSIMISELNTVDAQSKICVTVYKFF